MTELSIEGGRRDRIGDRIRGEALRLAFSGKYPDIPSITAALVGAGFIGVEEAISGWVSLASICRQAGAPKSGQGVLDPHEITEREPGLAGMFIGVPTGLTRTPE